MVNRLTQGRGTFGPAAVLRALSDGRVDHREQRGGQVNHPDAAQPRGRQEAREEGGEAGREGPRQGEGRPEGALQGRAQARREEEVIRVATLDELDPADLAGTAVTTAS